MAEKYPKWINEYAKSFHNAFSKMVPLSWGPIDAVSLIAFLNGTFILKVYEAIQKIKRQKYKIEKVAEAFSSSSTLRPALFYLIWEYRKSRQKNKKQFKEIAEYIVKILSQLNKKDIFAYRSNIIHSGREIQRILDTTKWAKANSESARELGKLYNSLSSLVFALYKDFFPQISNEIYGPYNASKKFGENTTLLIKYFPKIKPVELWPKIKRLKYQEVKIYQVYKNIKFRCETVGFHSIYEGSPVNNLIACGVMVDNKYQNNLRDIKNLSNYFAKVATEQSMIYEELSKKKLKIKVLEWLCYQFFDFFKLAQMDWRPTMEMVSAIKNKDVQDKFELNNFPSFKKYMTSSEFEIYWLKDLYK